jgi:quercetin dioxygenase-like cupin family protein
MNTNKVDFDAIGWTTPMPNVRFKVHRQGNRQLRLVEFSEGFVEPDWCTRGHIGLVLEGAGRLQFQGSEITLKAGDGIFLQAGEEQKHKLTVLSKVVRIILVEDVQG